MSTERRPYPEVSVRDAVTATSRWSLRLLVVAALAYVLGLAWVRLSVVTVPLVVALLLTALLVPGRAFAERRGLPRPLAAGVVFVVGIVLVGLLAWGVDQRATVEGPLLVDEVEGTLSSLRSVLTTHGLGFGDASLSELQTAVSGWAARNRGLLVGDVLAGVGVTVRAVFGVFLTLVLTFILVWDGDRLWHRLVRAAGPRWSVQADAAGRAAWNSVSGYVHGTLVIAAFHGTIIAVTLTVLGVPLAGVLALLVLLGSFVPIVGALLAGSVTVLVAFAARGVVAGVVTLTVLLLASQVEAHLLQPVLMRRFVRVHPAVTVLAVASLGVLWGIPGALVAVPLSSVVGRVVPVLLGRTVVDARGHPHPIGPSGPADGDDAGSDGAREAAARA